MGAVAAVVVDPVALVQEVVLVQGVQVLVQEVVVRLQKVRLLEDQVGLVLLGFSL